MPSRHRGTSSAPVERRSALPALIDAFDRPIRYLRLSIIDRCNYRCFYCLPAGSRGFVPHAVRLNAGELVRLAGLFVDFGIKHIRLTGGEPLTHPDLADIAAALSARGVTDLSLSTNGHLLGPQAALLHRNGVGRVNVSVDSLRPHLFSQITGGGDLRSVLRGIDAARDAGMEPVKVNMLVMAGVNDSEIEAMFDFARAQELELRFIETMPVGVGGRAATRRYYPAERIRRRLAEYAGKELIPAPPRIGAGPARHYRVGTGSARIGIISALSRHFCDNCNRVRLTVTGDLVLCLGADAIVPLGQKLRDGANDDALRETILRAIADKPAGHNFSNNETPLRPMSALGG